VIPDERTAPTVKRIFELYTSGRLGTAAIARQLADEQAPAPPAGWQPAVVQLEQRRALADEARRAERALNRYYAALEAGDLDATRFEKRVSALEARLTALREQDADLAQQLAPQAATSHDAALCETPRT